MRFLVSLRCILYPQLTCHRGYLILLVIDTLFCVNISSVWTTVYLCVFSTLIWNVRHLTRRSTLPTSIYIVRSFVTLFILYTLSNRCQQIKVLKEMYLRTIPAFSNKSCSWLEANAQRVFLVLSRYFQWRIPAIEEHLTMIWPNFVHFCIVKDLFYLCSLLD